MTEGGNLCFQSINVEWKIDRFFYLPNEEGYLLQSPHFTFCDSKWCLRFYPNGTNSAPGWISLYLRKELSQSLLLVTYTFGIRKIEGSILKSFSFTKEFKKTANAWGPNNFILKSVFLNSKDVVDREGTLRIYCTISMENCEPEEQKSLLENIEELKEKLSASNKEKEAAVENIRKQDLTLSESFKELFQSRYEADTTVRVGAKEFLVHKVVLASRSSVFHAMFETDMAEKNDGIINIEDCEPGPFEDFLLFLYGGQFNIVKPSNALKLCLIADKYNVVQLKEKCFEVMSKEMSPESVCDAVYLATLYNEEELLNIATKYFIANMQKIVCTPKWISFLLEHTEIANSILVKVAIELNH